jgi:ligand-binding sensor domain-containing protein
MLNFATGILLLSLVISGPSEMYYSRITSEIKGPIGLSILQMDATSDYALDNNIRSIFQDTKGTYWFGTNGAGVYRYDNTSLTQFSTDDGLVDNQVLSIQEDNFGNMWFGTGAFGISKFDGTHFTTITHWENIKRSRGRSSDWKSDSDNLWFKGGNGVFRWGDQELVYLPFDSVDAHSTAKEAELFGLSRNSVYCILEDKKGNVWFGTQAQGVCRYNGKELTWFSEKGLAGPAVLGLFEDSRGNIWFGNNGAGLFRFDGTTLVNFTEEKGLANPDFRASGTSNPGTLARVYCINEDKEGNIWIGTVDAGVWKYDGTALTNYTMADGLTSDAINTIYKDNKGELWFGTDENGICKFNGTRFMEFIVQ